MTLMMRIQRLVMFLRDPRVAKLPRFAVLAAAAYLISPVDLLPEFVVPVVGWMDDAVLVWMALRWLTNAGEEAERASGGTLDIPTAKRVD